MPLERFGFASTKSRSTQSDFVELLKKMIKYCKNRVHLVLDSLPADKKAVVRNKVLTPLAKLQQMPRLARLFLRTPSGAYWRLPSKDMPIMS